MPTFKNEYAYGGAWVTDIYGNAVYVNRGDIVESYYILDTDPCFVRLSNEPYYNPVKTVNKPSGSDDLVLNIKEESDEIEVCNTSGVTINVYLESKNNTPPFYIVPNTVRNISQLRDRVSTLIFTFDGSVVEGEVIITELWG